MSLTNQIWTKIEARLLQAGQAIDPAARVVRNPSGDLTPGTELALHTGTIRRVLSETGAVHRRLTFRIEGSRSGDDPADVAEGIDALHAAAVDALILEPTLDGLAETLEDTNGTFSAVLLSEIRIEVFDQTFELEFPAPQGRLSTPNP